MFRTTVNKLNTNDPAITHVQTNMTGSRKVRNTANFLIRNTMTAVSKEPEARTEHEKSVMERIEKAIPGFNKLHEETYQKKLKKPNVDPSEVEKPKPMVMPTKGKWMLSYEFIDYVLKSEKNEAYYGCTSQVNQQAIRKTIKSWRAFFGEMKSYRQDPSKFKAMPHIPKYIRTDMTTAHFTNQVAEYTVEDGIGYLTLTGSDKKIKVGPDQGWTFVKAEFKYRHGDIYLHATFDDKQTTKAPVVSEKASRFLGIDPGVSNFMTVTNNIGLTPFIIDGKRIKSVNQWFNKERARAFSIMTRGHDIKEKGLQKSSLYTFHLSARREGIFRDWFYKLGHYILRYARDNKIDAIVIGHNEDQKQEIDLKDRNNQNFVSIPYLQFIKVLQNLAFAYQIPVISREESYTSQSSLLNMDPIPTYKKGSDYVPTFSGNRSKRGLYKTKDGRAINADVNGGGNIMRKEFPKAFDGQKDLAYLTNTVKRIQLQEIIDSKHNHKKPQTQHKHFSRKSAGSKKRAHEKRDLKLANMRIEMEKATQAAKFKAEQEIQPETPATA